MSKRGIDGAGRKRAWLRKIVELVRRDPGVTIDRIQAEMAWQEGLSPGKVSEYVETLVQVGQLKEEEKGFSVTGKK